MSQAEQGDGNGVRVLTALPPDAVEVARDFFVDGQDLIDRYSLCFEHFQATKSQRFKCFVDLRMALECLLKSGVAYFADHKIDREAVIRLTGSYSHRIGELLDDLSAHLNPEVVAVLRPLAVQMTVLPVGLRYALDGYDFRDAKEDLYYETIGSDVWLEGLKAAALKLADNLDAHLEYHSGIIDVGKIPFEELIAEKYNKFRRT